MGLLSWLLGGGKLEDYDKSDEAKRERLDRAYREVKRARANREDTTEQEEELRKLDKEYEYGRKGH